MATVASSALRVPQSRIRELAEIAMKMDGVLRLYFGESNVPTPEYIKTAALKALEEGYTFYTENAGLPGLRQDLADYYRRVQGVELDPRVGDRCDGFRCAGLKCSHSLCPQPGG